MDERFTIVTASEKDVKTIATIAGETLGDGYFTPTAIGQVFADPSTIFRVTKTGSGHIAGFCYSYIAPFENINQRWPATQWPDTISSGKQVGVLKTIAVSTAYTRSGIGNQLMQDAILQCRKRAVPFLLTLAWKDQRGTMNLEPLLRKFQFRLIREFPEYWKEESLVSRYQCPVCGEPPCLCSALLFGKNLD